jgi:hypothetical protein
MENGFQVSGVGCQAPCGVGNKYECNQESGYRINRAGTEVRIT